METLLQFFSPKLLHLKFKLHFFLHILIKSNGFMTGRYPNSNGNKLYILTLLWMTLTIWAEKNLDLDFFACDLFFW